MKILKTLLFGNESRVAQSHLTLDARLENHRGIDVRLGLLSMQLPRWRLVFLLLCEKGKMDAVVMVQRRSMPVR